MQQPSNPVKGSSQLLYQWGKDLQLWGFILLTLLLNRAVLIGVFHEQAINISLGELLRVFWVGLRFDISTSAAWVLLTFLASLTTTLLPWGRGVQGLRSLLASLYIGVAVLVFGANLIFFDEYGDQFNQRIFGIIYDDTWAILVSVWKEYHPLLSLAIAIPLIWAGNRLIQRWLQLRSWGVAVPMWLVSARGRRILFAIAVALFFIFAARGGSLWGEPIRIRYAFMAEDMFLNRTVLNPFAALRYTLKAKLTSMKAGGITRFWPEDKLSAAIERVSRLQGRVPTNDLDQLMTRTTQGGTGHRARHVFLILMESQSGWVLHPQYRHLGYSPELAQLGDEGLYFANFLPASWGTISTLDTLFTGMPYVGLPVNYEAASLTPFPSSVAATFNRMGYKTRFFYGGYLGWQRVDEYTKNQGFDELHGGGQMPHGPDANVWGVNDRDLLDYVLETVTDEQPSFNFILTTTNHTPFDLDLQALGYPYPQLPDEIRATKAETETVLGHLWYADQQVGRFMRAATEKLPQALFAATGDHTARLEIRFPGDNFYERYAVPLVLYGPQVLQGVQVDPATPGSHLDLLPTLYELAAPAGFEFIHYGGRSLLQQTVNDFAFNERVLIGADQITNYQTPPRRFRLPGQKAIPEDVSIVTEAIKNAKAIKALSWYRIRNGNRLPDVEKQKNTAAK